MYEFLNIEVFHLGYDMAPIRLFHLFFIVVGLWLFYILTKPIFEKTEKVKTLEDAQAMVKEFLGSQYMLFPPRGNLRKYTITYNPGGEGDVDIAIAQGNTFKEVFNLARDWISNNYVNKQLGKNYYVLLPDPGNDNKYIILHRPKGTPTADLISKGNTIQDAVENAFLAINAKKGGLV